jgi:hypothetical protein
MSLHWFTDATSGGKVAVNSEFVVAVFTAKEGEVSGKTIIGLVNGNVVVDEDEIDVVSRING